MDFVVSVLKTSTLYLSSCIGSISRFRGTHLWIKVVSFYQQPNISFRFSGVPVCIDGKVLIIELKGGWGFFCLSYSHKTRNRPLFNKKSRRTPRGLILQASQRHSYRTDYHVHTRLNLMSENTKRCPSLHPWLKSLPSLSFWRTQFYGYTGRSLFFLLCLDCSVIDYVVYYTDSRTYSSYFFNKL